MNNKGKGITYIGAEMTLNGEIDIKGPALIAGNITGTVRSSDQIKIELGGEIDGEVFCQELRVSGTLKGKLFCNKLVIVSTGVVEADVSSHDMEIYDGGQFIGMRTIGPESSILPLPTHAITSDEVEQPFSLSSPSDGNEVTETQKSLSPQPAKNIATADDTIQPNNKPHKALLSVCALILMTVGLWQVGGLDFLTSPKTVSNEPALFTQPSPPVASVTERNAAKLLKDVQDEHSFIEQREELVNAGLADPDVAMEDLDAMAASNALMADDNEAAKDAIDTQPANKRLDKEIVKTEQVATKPSIKQ